MARHRLLVAATLCLAVLAFGQPSAEAASKANTQALRIGGEFELVDPAGRTVTDADFSGRFMLIYFGYMYCPDICPTALSRMTEALDLLGDQADRVIPIFITIDPQRDTPRLLGEYVESFHPRMLALTGSEQQVAAAAKAYRVYYAKRLLLGEDAETYSVDHSSVTYFMGPDGRQLAHFLDDTSPEAMARRLRTYLTGSGQD